MCSEAAFGENIGIEYSQKRAATPRRPISDSEVRVVSQGRERVALASLCSPVVRMMSLTLYRYYRPLERRLQPGTASSCADGYEMVGGSKLAARTWSLRTSVEL